MNRYHTIWDPSFSATNELQSGKINTSECSVRQEEDTHEMNIQQAHSFQRILIHLPMKGMELNGTHTKPPMNGG